MSCVCGSFQCTCQEKFTCMAKDCKRCNELRSDRPLKSTRSEEKISPTRGATALLTDLQISNNRSTSSVSFNYPDRNLVFPGRTSDGKSLSRASEQSATEICKEFSTHSSPDSPKARCPKGKLSATDSSPSDVKRQSPCRNNQNDILPKTLHMGVCPPDTEVKAPSSKRSEEIDKSGPVNLSAKESNSQTSDSSTLQEPLLTHSSKLCLCICGPTGSSESKNAAVIQKNVQLPTEPKHNSSSSSNEDCTTDEQFLSAQVVNKSLSNRNSESEAREKDSDKSKSPEKKESTNWQSKSGNSSKSRQMSVASSEVSRPTSRSEISRGASDSARRTSGMESTVQGATSDTSESSQQASSRRSSFVFKRPDFYGPVDRFHPRIISGICYEVMEIAEVISEGANSSTDSDSSLELSLEYFSRKT